MKKLRFYPIAILLVFQLAGARQLAAQCLGPMSVPVAGSATGEALAASETHVDADCAGANGSVTISATGGTAPYMGTGTFSQMVGTQTYTVTDFTGCTATVEVTIAVDDNTPPSITCPTLNLVLTPDPGECTVSLTGTQYDPVVSDACGISSTEYTIVSGNVMPSSGSSLSGAVLGAGNHLIEWTTTDVNGNPNSCQFTLTVNACIVISGNLIWKGDELDGVGSAKVFLAGDASDTYTPTAAGALPAGGAYTLVANMGANFTVRPEKHLFVPPSYASLLNGLTVGDALAIQQHLVGSIPITDPYRQVAADCNKSNTLSTLDAAIIRQALLFNPSALAILNTTKSWRFIPTYYPLIYIGPYNIDPGFPETISFTGLLGNSTGNDFFGIKVGDVLEDANPALRPDPDAKPLVWRVRNRPLKAGETIRLDFSVANFTDIAAYQYALSFDPAVLRYELVESTNGEVPLDASGNFGAVNAASGELRTLWSSAQGVTLPGVARMFRLYFTVQESGRMLSEVIRLDPALMSPVAYTSAQAKRQVELQFTDYSGVSPRDTDAEGLTPLVEVALFQNRPNPFTDRTVIGFMLPEACDAQLRVLDASGRELYRVDQYYPAGYQEVVIDLSDLRSAGTLYYELTTPYGKQSRKMTAAQN